MRTSPINDGKVVILLIASGVVLAGVLYYASLQAIVLGLFFLLCGLPIVISIRRGTFDLLEPIILYSVFMCMVGIAIFDRVYLQELYFRYSHLISVDPEKALFVVTVLYVVFFATVLIGYYLDIEKWIRVPELFPESNRLSPTLLKRISYAYMILGSLFYLLLVILAMDGDLLLLFEGTKPRSQIFAGNFVLMLGADLLPLGYLTWLAALVTKRTKPKLRHILPVFPLTVAFFLLGGRGQAISIVISTIVFLYYAVFFGLCDIDDSGLTFVKDKLHFYAKMTVVPILGFVISIVILLTGVLRQGNDLESAITEVRVVRILTAGIHNILIDNLIATLWLVPSEFGYYWGTFSFRVLLNWIPRRLWNDKPVLSAGSELRRVLLPEQSGGRPPGQIGRFFIDLGYPGIILGALFTGIVLRIFYELLNENGDNPVFLIIYSSILFSVAKGGLTNGVLWTVMTVLVLLVPLVSSYYFWAE